MEHQQRSLCGAGRGRRRARNLTEGNVGADEQPRVSPDGKFVAYVSQARDGYESDQWKLKLLDLHSGKAIVAGDFDDDVGPFQWRHDSKGLVAGRVQKGRMYLESVALDGQRVTALWNGKHRRGLRAACATAR